MASITEKELAGIHKELKELNRRLDRLCRASIFSINVPEISVVPDEVDLERVAELREKYLNTDLAK